MRQDFVVAYIAWKTVNLLGLWNISFLCIQENLNGIFSLTGETVKDKALIQTSRAAYFRLNNFVEDGVGKPRFKRIPVEIGILLFLGLFVGSYFNIFEFLNFCFNLKD